MEDGKSVDEKQPEDSATSSVDAKDTPALADGAVAIPADERAKLKDERSKIEKSKAMWAEAFRYIDQDADGIMTFEEAEVHAKKKAKKHKTESVEQRPRFDAWDSNSDGIVTIVEFRQEFPGWLKKKREEHTKKELTGQKKKKEG